MCVLRVVVESPAGTAAPRRPAQETIKRAAAAAAAKGTGTGAEEGPGAQVGDKRKGEWEGPAGDGKRAKSGWDGGVTPSGARNRWDATPAGGRWDGATPSRAPGATPGRNRWDATPADMKGGSKWGATPAQPGGKASRWEEIPAGGMGATPAAYGGATPAMGKTAVGGLGLATPMVGPGMGMTPEMVKLAKVEREMLERNRRLTDEELNQLMPATGYVVVDPPGSYQPIRTPARKLMATPTPMVQGYTIPEAPEGPLAEAAAEKGIGVTPDGIELRPEDQLFFGKLAEEVDEAALSVKEAKERKIMRSLLKIKNGTPQQRKSAMRFLTEKARDLGAGPIFDQVLPLLMQPTLDDQERHLLVKVIDRVLFRLDDLVRPFVHKILVVITPLLIDEDYYARVEGREIIANLAKAAGVASMIAAMRPDIDNPDEYVRNTTARAFSGKSAARVGRLWHRLGTPTAPASRTCLVRPPPTPPLAPPLALSRSGGVGAGHPRPGPLPQGRVQGQEVVAGASHGHQDRAADCHSAGLRGAAPPDAASRGHRARPGRREPKGPHHHGPVAGGPGRGVPALRHRVLRPRH